MKKVLLTEDEAWPWGLPTHKVSQRVGVMLRKECKIWDSSDLGSNLVLLVHSNILDSLLFSLGLNFFVEVWLIIPSPGSWGEN